MIEKTSGFYIINGVAISLTGGVSCAYPEDATVQTFDTEGDMLAAHKAQYPEQYEEEQWGPPT